MFNKLQNERSWYNTQHEYILLQEILLLSPKLLQTISDGHCCQKDSIDVFLPFVQSHEILTHIVEFLYTGCTFLSTLETLLVTKESLKILGFSPSTLSAIKPSNFAKNRSL